MRLFIQASHPSDLTYSGGRDHIEEVIAGITDDTIRNRIIDAIERAEGNHVEVSEATLSAFMDAVAKLVVQREQ